MKIFLIFKIKKLIVTDNQQQCAELKFWIINNTYKCDKFKTHIWSSEILVNTINFIFLSLNQIFWRIILMPNISSRYGNSTQRNR
jgi:hypothetical protein